MEKLLHERLQQYSTDDSSFGILDGTRISALYASETKAIADEIEHYYIPRPRFEDGKPVQFGDDIEHPDTGDKCVIQSINIFNDGKYCFALQGTAGSAHYMKDEFVKRPAPKVLDADGVEIKVGDTVYPTYGIYQGILSNVLDADDEAAILIDVGNSFEKYARTALTAPSRVVFKDHDEWGAYVPERACVLTHATGGGEFCSHCGVYVSGRAMADAIDWLSVNYCPNCGARVDRGE